MARQFWPDRDPLSDEVQIGAGLGPEWADSPRRVVGIVGDVRDGGLDRPPVAMMYVPMAQTSDQLTVMHARVPMLWFVRTRSDPFTISAVVLSELAAATGVPVARDFIRSMDQMVAESIGRQSFNMFLMTMFGCAALLLAGVGIYGVTAFLVQQRTEEIGIRLALGATPAGVRHMVVVQSTRLALAGVVLGIIAALGMARLVAAMLFGVRTYDVITFVLVPCMLLSIAFAAAWVPARHAANVDPLTALRAE
jgi:hypothetical protein